MDPYGQSGGPGGIAPREVPPHEPAINIPRIVILVIAVLCLVSLAQWAIGPEREVALMQALALVPARISIAFGAATLEDVVSAARAGVTVENARQVMALIAYFVREQDARWWTLLTHALMHGGALHLAMNCLWLAIFGSPVARRFGASGFLALLAVGAAAGGIAHILSRPLDYAPMIGASGAVSAATGAAARFVFSQGFRPGAVSDDIAVRMMPALGPIEMLRNRQALGFVAIWFITNWLFGAVVTLPAGVDQEVAWQAHVGGFLAGLLLFGLFDRHRIAAT